MNGFQREELAKVRREAQADYYKHPMLCEAPGCKEPIPYGRYLKGAKFHSQMCAVVILAAANRGRLNPRSPQLPETAEWNGKVHKLKREHQAPAFRSQDPPTRP
jgi:hypothetical protein